MQITSSIHKNTNWLDISVT